MIIWHAEFALRHALQIQSTNSNLLFYVAHNPANGQMLLVDILHEFSSSQTPFSRSQIQLTKSQQIKYKENSLLQPQQKADTDKHEGETNSYQTMKRLMKELKQAPHKRKYDRIHKVKEYARKGLRDRKICCIPLMRRTKMSSGRTAPPIINDISTVIWVQNTTLVQETMSRLPLVLAHDFLSIFALIRSSLIVHSSSYWIALPRWERSSKQKTRRQSLFSLSLPQAIFDFVFVWGSVFD